MTTATRDSIRTSPALAHRSEKIAHRHLDGFFGHSIDGGSCPWETNERHQTDGAGTLSARWTSCCDYCAEKISTPLHASYRRFADALDDQGGNLVECAATVLKAVVRSPRRRAEGPPAGLASIASAFARLRLVEAMSRYRWILAGPARTGRRLHIACSRSEIRQSRDDL